MKAGPGVIGGGWWLVIGGGWWLGQWLVARDWWPLYKNIVIYDVSQLALAVDGGWWPLHENIVIYDISEL
jgi:hypothetical protein